MKIGAGGLQAYATHDDVAQRQTQESRRPDLQPKPLGDVDATAVNKDGLNKTVERLNDAAQAFDLPLRFVHQQNEVGEDLIAMSHTDTDTVKSLQPHEASTLLNKMLDAKGLNIDEYI